MVVTIEVRFNRDLVVVLMRVRRNLDVQNASMLIYDFARLDCVLRAAIL